MTQLLALAPALLAASSKSTKTTSSGSVTFLIFIVIVVAALYFLFLRPNQQRARKQREENASIGVGDKVASIGGIVGTIEEIRGDRVVLVSGDGGTPTRLVLLRSAIARKVDTPPPAAAGAGSDEYEHEEADESGTEGDSHG